MDKKKLITLLLALTMILSLSVGVSAAETTEAKVPITLTVVNTVTPISCTVPACLPVSLVDGYVVTANNAMITNTGKNGAIRVTKVDVQAGTFEIGSFDDFSAGKNSIALSINGCATKGAGSLTLVMVRSRRLPLRKISPSATKQKFRPAKLRRTSTPLQSSLPLLRLQRRGKT